MSAQADHPDIEKLPVEVDGIPVRETLREFFRKPEHGKPDCISKEGCLALALKSNKLGSAAPEHSEESSKTHILWNAWRDAFPSTESEPEELKWTNAVDFSDVDFSSRDMNFSLYHWGDGADFGGAKWGDGADFGGAKWGDGANFGGAKWGDRANFSGAQWGNWAYFAEARWGKEPNFSRAQWKCHAHFHKARWGPFANFSSANWGDWANFSRAQWGYGADFSGAHWDDHANFSGAHWDEHANFSGGSWGNEANFSGAHWDDHANFNGGSWGNEANFRGAQWGDSANFSCAHWGGEATFTGAQWGDRANFSATTFQGDVDFSATDWASIKTVHDDQAYGPLGRGSGRIHFDAAKTWAENRGISPSTWRWVSFQGARFGGTTRFTNRVFLAKTNFGLLPRDHCDVVRDATTGRVKWVDGKVNEGLLLEAQPRVDRCTHFAKVPEFHGCTLHHDTSFDGAVFPGATGEPGNARGYRTLKLAFSQQQALREEQYFFRMEVDEEAQREMGLKRWLFRAYRFFSDYGFSISKPLVVLLVCAIVLGPVHTEVPQWCVPIGSTGTCDLWQPSVWANGFWYGTPLGGIHVTESPIPALQMAGIVLHKTISLAALFLAGLALRNLFKLK